MNDLSREDINCQIQSIKESIGQTAEIIIAKGLCLVKVGKKYRCPNTALHKNGDKNPSMSWDQKLLQFHCFTCSEKYDIYRYYREARGMTHKEIMEQSGLAYDTEKKPKQMALNVDCVIGPLLQSQIEYLASRGLARETAEHFGLGNVKQNIAMPYLDDGRTTGIKIKNLSSSSPKYFSAAGSSFGLFNKTSVSGRTRLIITEGEFDCMTVFQCGFQDVVSVGTGANSLNDLLRTENGYLSGFESIIILSDNDEAGANMDKTFLKAWGYKVKLPNKDYYLGCKDMNEIFLKHGTEQIKIIVESTSLKIEGLRDLDAHPYNGIASIEGRYIPTGLASIDIAINDLAPGLVTLITGRSNAGKSVLVNQIAANAIDKGNRVLLIAGEGLQEIIINNIYRAVIGRDEALYSFNKINKRYFKEPKPEVLEALKSWHSGRLILFNKGDSKLKTTDELFDLLEHRIKTARSDLVIIDNLMSVLSIEKASEKLERQADFMQRCCDFAKSERIHIILVVHPNKTLIKGSNMDFEQISGTQDLANKADNIIGVKRNYNDQIMLEGADGEIEVLKNRYFPDLPKVKTHYDTETGALLEISDTNGNYMAYTFKWREYFGDDLKALENERKGGDELW